MPDPPVLAQRLCERGRSFLPSGVGRWYSVQGLCGKGLTKAVDLVARIHHLGTSASLTTSKATATATALQGPMVQSGAGWLANKMNTQLS
ncbi:hypothetical protein DBV08_05285 [Rhodococcus sp. KBW08]|nr:hypothetical protein DBV08_05285 [Rhodococcus sp. KBW08]